MKSIESRLDKLERKMNLKEEKNKTLVAIIHNESYEDKITFEFLTKKYPDCSAYYILPDNGRSAKKPEGPYSITIF